MAAARGFARSLANRMGEELDDQFASAVERRPLSTWRERKAATEASGGERAAAPEKAGKPEQNKTARPAGKRPGAKGFWRSQPIVTSAEVESRAIGLRRLRSRPRSRPEAPMRRRPQQPRTRPRRHVSASHGDQARLLRRALPLRPRQRRPTRRGVALGDRGPPAELANERALPGGPDARDLHRGVVAPLPPLAAARSRNSSTTGWDWSSEPPPSSAASTNSAVASEPVVEQLDPRTCARPRSSMSTRPPGIRRATYAGCGCW